MILHVRALSNAQRKLLMHNYFKRKKGQRQLSRWRKETALKAEASFLSGYIRKRSSHRRYSLPFVCFNLSLLFFLNLTWYTVFTLLAKH